VSDLRDTLDSEISGTYTIERELGGGGMSRVFVAIEKLLDRRVVIKVLPEEVAAGISADRFRREIQVVAKFQHPHIVPVLSAGEVLGRPYFTMPFVEGESLRARLDRTGDLHLPDAVRILREVAAALAYAHRQGIVHRDIKPDNVLISDEFALVTDFGVAKALRDSAISTNVDSVTTAGLAIGTPAYMSPEQVSGDPHLDHRSDIYSFGILAYEMVTGATPFSGRNTMQMLAAHAIVPPDPIEKHRPNLAPWLGELIMRCLEKRPSDRPQTASEIVHLLQQSDEVSRSGQMIEPHRKRPQRRGIFIGVSVVLVVLAIAGALFLRGKSSADVTDIRSVAVLPLVNVGGTAQDEYFSDGMSDELANALNRIPGLRVASRTSSYTFKNRKDVDVGEIGRKLNVQAVLEGTVRRAGTRLRVTGQLTSTRDGLSIWSDTYERNADDVFSVQEDIARSIVTALQPRLSTSRPVVATNPAGTTNVNAYDAYLRGRYLWNARGAENLKNAVGHFDRAIALDPNFSRAYAARAMAYALLPEYTDTGPKDASARSIADARRALRGDASLAEAHTAVALASAHEWNWDAAEAAYKKAIAADPGYPTAHQWYGELLYNTSRLDSSIAETRRARSLDPLAPILSTALGYALTIARRYDEALVELRRGLELAPNLGVMHSVYGFANLFAGKTGEARAELETAVRNDPDLVLRKGQLAYVYASTGDPGRARAILDEMRKSGVSEESHAVAFAIVYIALGEKDKALSLLESAVKKRDIGLLTAASPLDDPTYDPIRNDPRFVRILDQMDLARFRH
jgi:serine/threonine-protein kinase